MDRFFREHIIRHNYDSKFWLFPFLPAALGRQTYRSVIDATETLGILPVRIEEVTLDPAISPELKFRLDERRAARRSLLLSACLESSQRGLLPANPEWRVFVLEKRQDILPSMDSQNPVFFHGGKMKLVLPISK
jgi:hypothetical protein